MENVYITPKNVKKMSSDEIKELLRILKHERQISVLITEHALFTLAAKAEVACYERDIAILKKELKRRGLI